MRWFRILAVVVLLFIAILAGMIAFGTAKAPQRAQSVIDPFRGVDYSDLPAVSRYKARDGSALSYREYRAAIPAGAGETQVAVLVHGSSDSGVGMHAMAKMLAQAGITVFVPELRGHGANQPLGDVAYVGQLDDDLADFVQQQRPRHPATRWSLAGFSSGGGFTLRIDGGPYGDLFDRYLLLSPNISYSGPTQRAASTPVTDGNGRKIDAQSWVAVHTGRIIALVLLNKVGVHWFDGLPVVAFAVPPGAKYLAPAYSLRMVTNLSPRADYLADIHNIHKPTTVMVGQADEFSIAEQFAPVFHSQRQDVEVTVLPRLGHLDMITNPAALHAVLEWFQGN